MTWRPAPYTYTRFTTPFACSDTISAKCMTLSAPQTNNSQVKYNITETQAREVFMRVAHLKENDES